MLDWLKNILHREPQKGTLSLDDGAPLRLRRWEAAKTDRLNSGHWGPVIGQNINKDLSQYLETVRARSYFEMAQNPFLEGVVKTYVTDFVGSDGPTLQLYSENTDYVNAAERVWREWWDMPDYNKQMSGSDLLQLWIRTLWPAGEFLAQIVPDFFSPTPIQTRILNIDPRRLDSPIVQSDPLIVMGVKRNRNGKPLSYFIGAPTDGLYDTNIATNPVEIPAAFIIHYFRPQEPGQARGVPWMATQLQVVADLRDYDVQVLDAARSAADQGVLLYNVTPDAPYMELNESTDIQRRTIRTLPPGWQAAQMKPEQPTMNYMDFRRERLREMGRPVNMPLMMVALDSSNHNYSSARFDGQLYHRGIKTDQAAIERQILNRLTRIIFAEAQSKGVLSAVPPDIRQQWVWPVPPHVDPTKEANAERQRLDNFTQTLAGACAAHGLDFDTVVAQLAKEKQALADAGLTTEPTDPAAQAGRALVDAIIRGMKEYDYEPKP